MARLTKIFKNVSGGTLPILGVDTQHNEEREIYPERWFEILTDTDLLDLITDGDVVVNDGTQDLSASKGLTHAVAFENFEGLVSPALDYQYAASESVSSTSSTGYKQKLRLTTTSLVQGTYRIGWSYQYMTTSNNKNGEFRVQLDDDDDLHEISPEVRRLDWFSASGFKTVDLSGVHNIDMDFRKVASGNFSVKVTWVRLEIWRVA